MHVLGGEMSEMTIFLSPKVHSSLLFSNSNRFPGDSRPQSLRYLKKIFNFRKTMREAESLQIIYFEDNINLNLFASGASEILLKLDFTFNKIFIYFETKSAPQTKFLSYETFRACREVFLPSDINFLITLTSL